MRPCSEEMLEAFDNPEFVSAYSKVLREYNKREREENIKKRAAAAEGRTVTVISSGGEIRYERPEDRSAKHTEKG